MTLLMDLRASLRRELRLEDLPPAYLTLRITTDGQAVADQARIWHDTSQAARQSASTEELSVISTVLILHLCLWK